MGSEMCIRDRSRNPIKIQDTTDIIVTSQRTKSTSGANVDADVGNQFIYLLPPCFLVHKNIINIINDIKVIAPPNFITFKALSAYFLPTGSKS